MDQVIVSTNLPGTPKYIISSESELMKNYQAALPVSPEDQISTVYDADGYPIIFSFSPDKHFYIIQHAEKHPTGWTQTDMNPVIQKLGAPKSFTTAQLSDGSIFLVLAISDISDASTENLFIVGPRSPDVGETDWTKLDTYCVKAANPHKGTTINKIFTSPLFDEQANGIGSFAVSITDANKSDITNFIIQSKIDSHTGDRQWNWIDFPTPTQMASMISYAMGAIADLGSDGNPGGQGIYMLYEGTGGEIFLVFKTFLNKDFKSYDRQFIPPPQPTSLQTAPGFEGTTALFVGGEEGIYWYSPGNQDRRAEPERITLKGNLPDIRENGLIVQQDEIKNGTISIWALSGENIYYLRNNFENEAANGWSTPVLFRKNVARIAPLRNKKKFANEIIYIGTDLEKRPNVYYAWQDPITSLWKDDHIPLVASDRILEFSCYTTHVSFTDEKYNPIIGQRFLVSADSWTRAIINGQSHLTDRDIPVQVATDVSGHITIINKANDLSTPFFHITAESFTGNILLNPSHKVYERLRQVQTADDIPCLPNLPDSVNKNDISEAIKNIMQFHPAENDPHAHDPGGLAIKYSLNGAAGDPHRVMVPTNLPKGPVFGMLFHGDHFEFHDAARVAETLKDNSENIIKIQSDPGDIFRLLYSAIDEVTYIHVVIDEGVTLVTKWGNTVAKIIIDGVEALYKALSWLFEKLKMLIEDLIKWLGHLFGWDDIWLTHKVIASMVTSGINSIADSIDDEITSWQKSLEYQMNNLESMVDQMLIPPEFATQNLIAKFDEVKSNSQGQMFSSPGGNWSQYQILHGGILKSSSVEKKTNDPVIQFINDIVIPTFTSLQKNFEKDASDIKKMLEQPNLTIQDVQRLLKDIIHTYVDVVKTLINGILQFVKDIIGDIKDALIKPADIPFLSAFYKNITGILGEDEELTFVNGLSLMIAVPLTYSYKAMVKLPLFSDVDYLKINSLKQQVSDLHLTDESTWYNMMRQSVPWKKNVNPSRRMPALNVVAMSSFAEPNENNEPAVNHKCTTIYSILGGAIGAIVGVIATRITFLVSIIDVEGEESALTAGDKASGANLAGLLFIIRDTLTFPVKDINGSNEAWIIRTTSWSLCLLKDLFNSFAGLAGRSDAARCMSAVSSIPSLGLALAADSLDATFVANDGVKHQVFKKTWSTWLSDITSNLGSYVFNPNAIIYQKQPESAPVTLPLMQAGHVTLGVSSLIGLAGKIQKVLEYREGETDSLVGNCGP